MYLDSKNIKYNITNYKIYNNFKYLTIWGKWKKRDQLSLWWSFYWARSLTSYQKIFLKVELEMVRPTTTIKKTLKQKKKHIKRFFFCLSSLYEQVFYLPLYFNWTTGFLAYSAQSSSIVFPVSLTQDWSVKVCDLNSSSNFLMVPALTFCSIHTKKRAVTR